MIGERNASLDARCHRRVVDHLQQGGQMMLDEEASYACGWTVTCRKVCVFHPLDQRMVAVDRTAPRFRGQR